MPRDASPPQGKLPLLVFSKLNVKLPLRCATTSQIRPHHFKLNLTLQKDPIK